MGYALITKLREHPRKVPPATDSLPLVYRPPFVGARTPAYRYYGTLEIVNHKGVRIQSLANITAVEVSLIGAYAAHKELILGAQSARNPNYTVEVNFVDDLGNTSVLQVPYGDTLRVTIADRPVIHVPKIVVQEPVVEAAPKPPAPVPAEPEDAFVKELQAKVRKSPSAVLDDLEEVSTVFQNRQAQ